MGHGENESIRRYLQDAHAADHEERRWLQGPRITSDDLRDGTGPIERISSAEWFGQWRREGNQGGQSSAVQHGAGSQARGPAAKAQPKAQGGALTMPFGKHKGRLAADVMEDDPGYWRWACENVAGFEARARKAGLLDDEEEAA